MVGESTHPKVGEEVRSIAGYYVFEREEVMAHGGRKLLYWVGYGLLDTCPCGVAGCGFALVGGYLKESGKGISAQGTPIGSVEEVPPGQRDEVAALIRRKESVRQVNFWPANG